MIASGSIGATYKHSHAPFSSLMMYCSDGTVAEEYLTIEELAKRLSVKPKTIRNKMANGILK